MSQTDREAKAARKADPERQQQAIAARQAALLAQGLVPESRAERQRRLAREAAARSKGQPHAEAPAVFARRSPAPPPAARRPPPAASGVQEETPRRAAG